MPKRSIVSTATLALTVALVASGCGGRRSSSAPGPYLVAFDTDNASRIELVRDGKVVKVLAAGTSLGNATWAPDHSRIAWIDQAAIALVVAGPDGGEKRVINGVSDYDWAPRGHELEISGAHGRVKVVDAATGRVTRVGASNGWGVGSPLPTGEILYSRTDAFDPHCDDLAASRSLGGKIHSLALVCDRSGLDGWSAVSPDGRRLLVANEHSSTTGTTNVMVYVVVDVGSGKSTPLKVPSDSRAIFWSSGGRVAFVTHRNGRDRISTVGAGGGRARPIVALRRGDRFMTMVAESPSGRRFAFTVVSGARERLVTVGADGSMVRTLASWHYDREVGQPSACWSADGEIALSQQDGMLIQVVRDRSGARVRDVFRATPPVYVGELTCP